MIHHKFSLYRAVRRAEATRPTLATRRDYPSTNYYYYCTTPTCDRIVVEERTLDQGEEGTGLGEARSRAERGIHHRQGAVDHSRLLSSVAILNDNK